MYHRSDPEVRNPWSDKLTAGEVDGQRGLVYFLLSQFDKRFENAAVTALDAAVVDFGTVRHRSAGMVLPCLAEAHLRAGERAKAVQIGHLACDTMPTLHCVRPYRRLLKFRDTLIQSSAADAMDLARRIKDVVAQAKSQ